ncbi:hypothetical protein BCR32DRAFT_291793 [Anaeromyces robustus]|uniref:Uncharacterized protein n=1 Tax=Anaeromyces robustus TaxID=1754192 RepID=A0A1Y1XDL4_9FUNG|nr:hypothetical protein BCR32DRAFT_291793 [Anaeromyces robustus]|eukprot:ORX83813.1 hypothetical protein BCR32DRAFT_291793 [Anaeromyces robustus]
MKRSLKELKERQKKKRQGYLENSNNRLTSYGFSSSKLNYNNKVNNIIKDNAEPKSNDNINSFKPSIVSLKRSQSLNSVPSKKIKAEEENTINTLICSHLKKKIYPQFTSLNPLKHTKSFNEIPEKKINKNPFQNLTPDNSVIVDPFSLLKNILSVTDENTNEKNEKEEPKYGLNNLSSSIFNIEYLNSEMEKFNKPSEDIEKEKTDANDDVNMKKSKITYDTFVGKGEFNDYDTRYLVESDDEMSLSERESVASETDIRDIEILHDNNEAYDINPSDQISINPEMNLNDNNLKKENNMNIEDKPSFILLDTLKQNDEVNMDPDSINNDYMLNGIKKKGINTEKESKKILDGNTFRDQLNLKSDNSNNNNNNNNNNHNNNNLKQKPYLPYDYTIKKKISFYSNSSFDWCGEQTTQDESICLQSFVKDNKLNDIYKRIQQLLYYYIYPSDQFSISSIKVLQKVLWKGKNKDLNDLINNPTISEDTREEIKYFRKIEDDWKQSFRSLYFNLKNRLTDCFYYINYNFAVIFLSSNMITNSNYYQAVLTNSTPYIKSLLENEGIDFIEVPFNPSSTIKIKQEINISSFHEKNGNILLFNDIISIHGLFNFLLNWKINQNLKDIFIPFLISTKPFLNSCIKSNQLFKNSIIKRSIYNIKQRKNITDEIYHFSIEGYILPSIYNELIHLLIEKYNNDKKVKKEYNSLTIKKDEGLYINMITDTRTIGMNIFKPNSIKKEEDHIKKENNDIIMKENKESNIKIGENINSDIFLKQILYYDSIFYYND